jgi:hypothetical protein
MPHETPLFTLYMCTSFLHTLSALIFMHRYPSGKHLTDKNHLLELGLSTGNISVMHFCWTHNITTKIVKMKALDALFIKDGCAGDPDACGFEAPGFNLEESCHDWRAGTQ